MTQYHLICINKFLDVEKGFYSILIEYIHIKTIMHAFMERYSQPDNVVLL